METRLVEGGVAMGAGRPVARPRQPVVNVIGIGVQKAATSWLYRCLVEHPGLRGAVREGGDKEINFFNRYHEYGYDWYERQFEAGDWQNMEFSVLYFHDRNVPARIQRYNPDARLVLCLRNPVDRALSQYRHEIRHGRIEYVPGGFWQALERNPSYVEQGLYASHLERWLEHFDLHQVHVVHYEDVRDRPESVVEGLWNFLRLPSQTQPSRVRTRTNESRVLGSGPGRRALGIVASVARGILGREFVGRLGRSELLAPVQRYRYVEVGGRSELPPDSAERSRLARRFEGELIRLGAMLERDYAHWT